MATRIKHHACFTKKRKSNKLKLIDSRERRRLIQLKRKR